MAIYFLTQFKAALWLGDLELFNDGLRDHDNLELEGAKLAEASLFAAKPYVCLGRVFTGGSAFFLFTVVTTHAVRLAGR